MTTEQYEAHQKRVKSARVVNPLGGEPEKKHATKENRARKAQEHKKAKAVVIPAKVSYERQLGAQLSALGIACEVDVHYLPGYKYRADVLIEKPGVRLVVEVQGQVHRIADKFQRDIVKAQRTILGGFTLFPVSNSQVRDGSACDLIQKMIGRKWQQAVSENV